MGLWSRIFGTKGMSSLELFREVYGGRESGAGPTVNWSSALEVTTVLACTRLLANGVAQVPFRLNVDDGAGKKPATDHPLYQVLYRRPNKTQSSFAFRETMMFHVVLTGNAFAWKGMVGSKREVRVLELIEPGRVTVLRDSNGVLTYRVRADDGASVEFSSDAIWHLRGPSWNAWNGMDLTKLAREAIGLAMATEREQSSFQKGGAKVSGVLSMKDKIGTEKFEFLSAWLDRHSEGGDRQGKPIILDNEAKWTSTQMSAVDSQTIETRKMQVEEICRAFGVMPIMVGQSDKAATYASAEQMFLAHVVHTLLPWYERIEQSADNDLLTDQERLRGFYTKFTPNALMRGAAKDRAEFYTKALGAGGHGTAWMTPNEVRQLEDMDPSASPGANDLPAGMAPAPATGA